MNRSSTPIRVGILRGGPSDEYEISIKTGGTILEHIQKHLLDKYIARDIFIDRSGVWHMNGMAIEPVEAIAQVDVIWNGLHGEYGEDGKVQRVLSTHGIPFTGSGELGSAIGMNKAMAKEVFKKHGLKTPRHVLIDSSVLNEKSEKKLEAVLMDVFRSFSLPVVVKPVSSGSSVGVSVVKGFHEFEDAVLKAFKYDDTVMVEEFISGVEATCGVIDDFRGTDIYALPPIEIRPHGASRGGTSAFFDHSAKYEGKADEIVPGNFTHEQKEEIMRLAQAVHSALGLRHYSRSDFIVSPRRGIYVLEVNTLPGMTEASLIPKALEAVGVKLHSFIDHILELAMKRK